MSCQLGALLKKFISKNGIKTIHNYSTATSSKLTQNEDSFEMLWKRSKSVGEIPGPNLLQLMCRFLPRGKYHNITLLKLHEEIRAEYGSICRLPGMLGNRDIILVYDASDFETIFRNEGIWPKRRGISTFDKYRKEKRADVFKDLGGLISNQGESWAKMRSIVSPILLKPSTLNAYIPRVDEIAEEFTEHLKTLLDANSETPANFGYELNKWSLESISAISLDSRLNIMIDRTDDTNSKSKQLIKAVDEFFTLSYELEMKPSLWRYFETPKFKQLMRCFDMMKEATLYYIDQALENLEKNRSTITDREPSVLQKLLGIDKPGFRTAKNGSYLFRTDYEWLLNYYYTQKSKSVHRNLSDSFRLH